MTDYKISIIVEGQDKASGPFGKVSGALGNMATIAGGILTSAVITKIASGVIEMGKSAIQATADFQALGVGIESLVARELKSSDAAMSMTSALANAQPIASGLLDQIRNLAITSPFELSTVQTVFKTGMAFQWTAEQSMKMTKGLLNVAAGTGASNDMLDRMAYNLSQVRLQGKVTAVDIRQLAQAGFDLSGALEYIGKTQGVVIQSTDDFNKAIEKGEITWEEFATGFQQYADDQFGGAATRLASTWNGMKSNFNDVFALSMPAIMGPALEKVTAFMNGFMGQFIDFTNSGVLKEWGDTMAVAVQGGIDKLGAVFRGVGEFFKTFASTGNVGLSLFEVFNVPPEVAANIQQIADTFERIFGTVQSQMPMVQTAIANFGAGWAAISPTLATFADTVMTGLLGLFEKLSSQILPWLSAQFLSWSEWFVANGPLINAFVTQVGVAFSWMMGFIGEIWTVIQPLLDGLMSGIQNMATMWMSIVTGDWNTAWRMFLVTVIGAFQAVLASVLNFMDLIANQLGTSLGEIRATTAAKWNEIKTNVITTWQNIVTGIQEKINSIIEAISTFMANAIDTFNRYRYSFYSAGANLIQGLWNGIASKIKALMEYLAEKARELAAIVANILKIKSPSRVMIELGQYIPEGLKIGIERGFPSAIKAMDTGTSQIAQAAAGTVNGGGSRYVTSAPVFYINGAQSPDAVADEIMRRLKSNGLSLAGV